MRMDAILSKIKKLCFFFLLLVIGLSGCSKDKEETTKEGQYYLYYTNKEGTELRPSIYTPENKEFTNVAKDMLSLLSENTSDIEKVKTIPTDVKIDRFDVQDKVAYVTFNSAYHKLDSTQDIICRGSVVLTLTQLKEIEAIRFYVDGESLTDKSGAVIEELRASDFVDTEADIINNYTKLNVTLYFANPEGNLLKPYVYEGAISNKSSVEKYIVEQLIAGPKEKEEYRKTIDKKVELIGVTTKDDICYVNFGPNFLTESMDIKEEITVYSIVNSLCELSHINKVQILINGEIDKTYHDKISLKDAFFRNLDYIEEYSDGSRSK